MPSVTDGRREFLRHTVATLAYRGGKVIRDTPEGFGEVRACETGRSAAEILRHVGELLEWAFWRAPGERRWRNGDPQPWEAEVEAILRRAEAAGRVPGLGGATGLPSREDLPRVRRDFPMNLQAWDCWPR